MIIVNGFFFSSAWNMESVTELSADSAIVTELK